MFLKFNLFSESFTASMGKFAISFLILHCGICLPAAAFMAFLMVFSAW